MPDFRQEFAEAWLQGFDDVPIGSEPKPVSEGLEAELGESAVAQALSMIDSNVDHTHRIAFWPSPANLQHHPILVARRLLE